MSYNDFMTFLNNGLPDATGGVMSSVVINLFNRAVSFFNGNEPTNAEFDNLLANNAAFNDIITNLSREINSTGQNINNNAHIEKQINIGHNTGNIQM